MPSSTPTCDGDDVCAADGSPVAELTSETPPGPVAVIMDFLAMTVDDYERMTKQLELGGGPRLSRRLYHWMRAYPDGVRVIEIWPDIRPFVRFLDRAVRPVVSSLRLSEPKVSFHPVPNYLTDDGV